MAVAWGSVQGTLTLASPAPRDSVDARLARSQGPERGIRPLAAVLVSSAGVSCIAAARRRHCRSSRGWSHCSRAAGKGTELASKGEDPEKAVNDLLVRAGLRNILGVEDNRMAQKLSEACEVATDMKRCVNDLEIKFKVVTEELAERTQEMESVKDSLNTALADLEEAKATIASLQARGSEHWATKKALEAERDNALREVEAAKKQVLAAEMKAEVDLKTAKAEVALAHEAKKKAEQEAEATRVAMASQATAA